MLTFQVIRCPPLFSIVTKPPAPPPAQGTNALGTDKISGGLGKGMAGRCVASPGGSAPLSSRLGPEDAGWVRPQGERALGLAPCGMTLHLKK